MLRKVLQYPDPRLSKVAAEVSSFDDNLATLVRDMTETLYDLEAIGLAATQIDVHQRVVVIDVSSSRDQLLVFINPEIVKQSDEIKEYKEGCLSVPGIYEDVSRPDIVTIKAFDASGKPFTIDADGLLSVCIQHEIDHLNGIIFVQYLSPFKRGRIKNKMLKEQRQEKKKRSPETIS